MERQFLNPLFIKNAGLIIIAPYLRMLFSRLELIQQDVFVDFSAQERAVQLLGYVASGTEDLPEYELVIQKVLCGMTALGSLVIETPLTVAEKEISDEMLKAITQHWKPLNATSIDGLRESFIMRDGKLKEDNEASYLRIEQKAFDVLLDQLPWSITPIKLPWLQKEIQVIWR